MKKIFKSKIFWITLILAIIIIGGWIAMQAGKKPAVEYATEAVKKGDLTQTVTATGQVDPAQDISLNFKSAGKLVFLPVDEGKIVKAGEVLARLDSAGLSAQVSQYRANLKSAQADLAKIQAGYSAEDIKVTEQKVIKTQNDLKNLKIERDTQLDVYRQKALDAANYSIFTVPVALDKVYNYLLNDNTTGNLQVSKTNNLNQLETSYYSVQSDFAQAKLKFNDAKAEQTNEKILIAADALRNVLFNLNDFLDQAFVVADSIIINSFYSQTDKDTIKSDVTAQQSTNNTALTSLQTAKSNLSNGINSYATSVEAAKNNLSIAQAELALKQAGPRSFELDSYEAKVAQAQAQLAKAIADLSDYAITAPIDGTITKVNFSIGEQTNLSGPVIQMLSTAQFEVKVDIPESDIAKVKIGDKTEIELDAFGSDHVFAGTVSFIDPAQTVIQDVTYYKTTVIFDNNNEWNQKLKSGMTADVTLKTGERKDVLYIPQRAVKIRAATLAEKAEKYAEVLINGQPQEKIVEIGLRGDNGLVEILSGLNEGELVITFKKNGK